MVQRKDLPAPILGSDVRGDAARPQLQALLRAAHEKRFDVALFWSLDRMTRAGVKDAIDTLYALDSAGVAFHSFREPYVNSLGPWRDAVIGLLDDAIGGSAAWFESFVGYWNGPGAWAALPERSRASRKPTSQVPSF